jgi:hypothetical protein
MSEMRTIDVTPKWEVMSEMRTIDVTPKWEGLMPYMIRCLEDPHVPEEAKKGFREELMDLAKVVDANNEVLRKEKADGGRN